MSETPSQLAGYSRLIDLKLLGDQLNLRGRGIKKEVKVSIYVYNGSNLSFVCGWGCNCNYLREL